jgi:hypothetical protein
MEIVIGPEAYVPLGIMIFAAAMTVVWQLIDALLHG